MPGILRVHQTWFTDSRIIQAPRLPPRVEYLPVNSTSDTLLPQSSSAEKLSVTAKRPLESAAGGHLPVLDGIRGIAILAVLLFHFIAPGNRDGLANAAVSWFFSYGALGVDLFFVLSGFLITGILYDSRTDEHYFRNFYMRRTLRIFPLYYGVLIIIFLVLPLVPALRATELSGLQAHQAWAWLYAVNIYLAIHDGWVLSYIEHFWSLAVEEQFYLIWPLAVWLLAAKPRAFLTFSLLIATASFVGRIAASLAGAGPVVIEVLTPFQLDALAIGGFFAVYLRQPGGEAGARRIVVPLALAGLGLLVIQFGARHLTVRGNVLESVRGGAFHLLLAALLLKGILGPVSSAWTRCLLSRPLAFLGKYSYGLYVYHHFFSYYFSTHRTDLMLAARLGCSNMTALLLQASAGIAASVIVAWLSFEFFEKHFLRLKRYWPSSHARILRS
jgi:peptidoglycan/LPS O-acetylase OafA/YrhL